MHIKPVAILGVTSGSIAEEAGIEKGDLLVSINDQQIRDVFDYRLLVTDIELALEIQKSDGEVWEIDVEKDEDEDLGLIFESSMMDEAKHCTNKCIFCFIDQMPKGMRKTLYFKDDDSRLSFLMGNYITLTNVDDDDLDRIIRYRMSPVNVSVHTTNPHLRVFMLKNKTAGNVLEKVKRLSDSGITVNCQIVLCRGINDGDELVKTISELAGMYPGVGSISVVPVGITRYREQLFDLEPYDSCSSETVITQVSQLQEEYLERYGSRVVYLADEFYIMAGIDVPMCEYYDDFPQLENGVGLIALLKQEFEEYLEVIDGTGQYAFPQLDFKRHISIATGMSAYGHILEMTEILMEKYNNVRIGVHGIKNDFFGENVTVTGLLTGGDIVSQLKGRVLGDELLICRCMLKADEPLFLDDYTINDVEEQLNIKINVVENNGKDFINKILGI